MAVSIPVERTWDSGGGGCSGRWAIVHASATLSPDSGVCERYARRTSDCGRASACTSRGFRSWSCSGGGCARCSVCVRARVSVVTRVRARLSVDARMSTTGRGTRRQPSSLKGAVPVRTGSTSRVVVHSVSTSTGRYRFQFSQGMATPKRCPP